MSGQRPPRNRPAARQVPACLHRRAFWLALLLGLMAGVLWLGRSTVPAAAVAAAHPAPMSPPAVVATASPLQRPPASPRATVQGERPLEPDTAQALARHCREQAGLKAPARQPAAPLPARHCAYAAALAAQPALSLPPADLAAARRQLQALMALRRRFFDAPTAQRLFGDEEAQAALTLAEAEADQYPGLTATEKAAYLATLRQALSPSAGALEQPLVAAEELLRLQAEAGADAAQQLARSAAIQAEWEQRHAAYQIQKQAILDAALSDGDKARQIEALLRRHYGPNELDAARAYDRHRSPPSP